jgi:MFS superfamily sulfate permease-like transporter
MTGVIVRSSANVQAGARTRLSTILHGLWLLAFVAALPGVLRLIPTASLAAILVFTGYKLVDWKNVKHLARYGRMPVVIYASTVVGIVATDLLTGVLIGIALTVIQLLYKISHIEIYVTQDSAQNRVDIYLAGSATFLKIPRIAKVLEPVPDGAEVHIHFENLVYIDHSCLELLASWKDGQEAKGSTVFLEWDGLTKRSSGLRHSAARPKAAA